MKNIDFGTIIFHPYLQRLIPCRDEYYNQVYTDKQYEEHKVATLRRFIIDDSKNFKTTTHLEEITDTQFKVISKYKGGGGFGHGRHDVYPDATIIICHPVNDESKLIKFHTETNCYQHTIPENEIKVL